MQEATRKAFTVVAENSTGFISTGKYLTSVMSGLNLGKLRQPLPTTTPNEQLAEQFRN